MIIFTLIFRRTPSVVPRERVVRLIVLILLYIIVDGSASCSGGVVERSFDGAFCADPFAVSALYGAPAAVGVVETFRALLERVARRGAFVLIRLSQYEPANAPSAVHRLIGRRYALAQIRRPVTLGKPALSTIRTEARLAVVKHVTSARTLLFCRWT